MLYPAGFLESTVSRMLKTFQQQAAVEEVYSQASIISDGVTDDII